MVVLSSVSVSGSGLSTDRREHNLLACTPEPDEIMLVLCPLLSRHGLRTAIRPIHNAQLQTVLRAK